jgi:hypothetical protein
MFNDFFDSLPRGRECLDHLQQISKARRTKQSRYAGLTTRALAAERQRWTYRQSSGRKMLRKALGIELQLERFREHLPALKVDLYLVEGKLTETPTPIVIEDAADHHRYRLVSVASFLGFKVDDVVKAGGNWEAPFPVNEPDTDDADADESDVLLEDYRQRQMALLDIIDDSQGQAPYQQDRDQWRPKIVELCGNDPVLRRTVIAVLECDEEEIFDETILDKAA